jgi:hypothetical protein
MQVPTMSVRTISLNEVSCDKEMHIVIYQGGSPSVAAPAATACTCECSDKLLQIHRDLREIRRAYEQLSKDLIQLQLAPAPAPVPVPAAPAAAPAPAAAAADIVPHSSPFFGTSVAPEPAGLVVRRLSDVGQVRPGLESDSKVTFQEIIDALPIPTRVVVAAANVLEECEEEAGEEAEEAEVALELEEFEYKGATYFRDSENLVYQKDAEDDLDDTPIGVWNEVKQKVIKYAKAA